MAGIVQLRSGNPFNAGFTPNLAGWYANRADSLGNPYPADKNIVNPADFAIPQPFAFGNSARNQLFGRVEQICSNLL